MITDTTVLLTQILEELQKQNQYLFDIRNRMDALENVVRSLRNDKVGAVDLTPVGGSK